MRAAPLAQIALRCPLLPKIEAWPAHPAPPRPALRRYHGITLGIDDLLLTPAADAARLKLLAEAVKCGPAEAADYTKCDARDAAQLRFNLVRPLLAASSVAVLWESSPPFPP